MMDRSPHWLNRRSQLVILWLMACGWSKPLISCSQEGGAKREQVLIFGLDDRVSGSPEGVRFDLKKTRKLFQEAIEKSKRLRVVDERSPEAYRAELTIAFASERRPEETEETSVYRMVHVDLVLSRWQADGRLEKLTSVGESSQLQNPEELDRMEGFELVLDQAVVRAVKFIDLQLLSQQLPAEEIERLLVSKDVGERLYVLRTLRGRQDATLVPRIINMLSDPNPDVIMEAVGVLVAQKDQRAVIPLIRMTRKRDQLFLLQIITALGEIQGPVARGYLFTLAAGHGSAAIRERARDALERLLRNQQAGGSESAQRAVALPRAKSEQSGPTRQGGP